MSDVEGQLLAVYDPKLIKDLLTELYENRGLNREQIISLNENVSVFNLLIHLYFMRIFDASLFCTLKSSQIIKIL